jgi:hypothetical protein
MGNVFVKIVQGTKTHVLSSINIFLQNLVNYEIMWRKTVQQDRPQKTV